jgi:L-aspartate oxidase
LASNSLLEGLVFARRIAARLRDRLPERRKPAPDARPAGLIDPSVVTELQLIMSRDAGGLRSATSLDRAAEELRRLAEKNGAERGLEAWEATNLITVAAAVVAAARLREESRGAHWRDDFDGESGAWQGHLITRLAESGGPGLAAGLAHEFVPTQERR